MDRTILKTNRISCFADEIDVSVDKQIALLKELGISWVEFRSGDGKGVADYTVEEAEALKKRFAENGIGISAVGSPIGKIDITDEFAPHLEKLDHVMDLAKVWETPYIRCFSFYLPQEEDADIYREEVLKRTEQMVKLAAERGIMLLHENEKGIYGDTAARCLDLMQNFYGDHYRATFDFANFVQCRQDTLEAYEMLKDYIEYIHVKDALSADGSVVPAGMGDGNVKAILTKLDQRGFDGYLSLEPHLSDFAGLKDLERGGKSFGKNDSELVFCKAYDALNDILNRK